MEFLRLQVMEQQNIIDDLTKVQMLRFYHCNYSYSSPATTHHWHWQSPELKQKTGSYLCPRVPVLPVHHPAFNFMLSNVNPHQWNINLNQIGQHLQTEKRRETEERRTTESAEDKTVTMLTTSVTQFVCFQALDTVGYVKNVIVSTCYTSPVSVPQTFRTSTAVVWCCSLVSRTGRCYCEPGATIHWGGNKPSEPAGWEPNPNPKLS